MAYNARETVRIIINLKNYAILLKDKNRVAEAKEMEERAETFLESLQSRESSYYLGFVPSEVLREYAILLCQEGEGNINPAIKYTIKQHMQFSDV